LNINQLAIYHWSDNSNLWMPLTSTVNISSSQVSAQTTEIGAFDVQAPLLCPADSSEPDDIVTIAKIVSTDGTPITQVFDIADDDNWIKFDAIAGFTYIIRTSNLSGNADTVITLYDHDSLTSIATDDDSGGGQASLLTWRATEEASYYVLIRNKDANLAGCNVTYDVAIRTVPPVYLPLIVR
jgi:hypothetical protein